MTSLAAGHHLGVPQRVGVASAVVVNPSKQMKPATAPSTIQATTPVMISLLVGRFPEAGPTHSEASPID